MSRRTEIQVGATVLIALAVLIGGVTWLKEWTLGRRVDVWTVRFDQAGGLGASDEVQVNGIRKGSVESMHLVGAEVIVKLALATDVRPTTDSRISIRNVGLMGEKVIAVDLRTTGQPYSLQDTIPGIYERGISEVMAELGSSVDAVGKISEQIKALADVMERDGDLAGTMRNFKQTSEELRLSVQENRSVLRATLRDFAAASRTAKALTTDREADLKRTLDKFGSAAENMDRLSVRLDSLRGSIQSVATKVDRGQGTLGKLVNDDKLYTDLNTSVQSLKALIEDIKKNPKKYLKLEIF